MTGVRPITYTQPPLDLHSREFPYPPPGEKAIGRLVVPALGSGKLDLSGNQAALAGSLENGGPVAFQVALNPIEGRDGRIEPCELSLDFVNDPLLL
jgi:hypothetical protein